jgi:hypothetical protein
MRGAKILTLGVWRLFPVWPLVLISLQTQGQSARSIQVLEFHYGFQFPFGDLKDRFGSNNEIGGTIQTVGLKNKIFFGLEGMFFFGSAVKEVVLSSLRTVDGIIIGIDGFPGDINLIE